MMQFLELVKIRQSDRNFSDKAVSRELMEKCVEASRLAPSACNSQPWRFIIVDEPELRLKVARETYNTIAPFNKFVMQAPVIAVIVIEKPKALAQIGGRIKDKDYYLFDIGITAEHFCLQAAEAGLGTCMIGWFNEKQIKKLLNIPAKRSVGLVIAVGYPEKTEKREKKRKPVSEILNYNTY